MLGVTKAIIDSIDSFTSHRAALPHYFWWLVALEFLLAGLTASLVRLNDFLDVALAARYALHVSTRIMTHAAHLDLHSYEDPVFYDKLERARVQGTDRIAMIQSSGMLAQQVVTSISLAAGVCLFSPWLLVVLIVCVVPAFLGETSYALAGYSLSLRQTPSRREMDYLRVIAGSKESAKELKLFGLGPFLVRRFRRLAEKLDGETIGLARRKMIAGTFLAIAGIAGYYSTYAYVIYETVAGRITLGTMIFLAGAIAGTSSNVQAVFSTFSSIADQALFLDDLLEFFRVKPKVQSKPNALPAPRPIVHGFEFRNVSFSYPSNPRPVFQDLNFRLYPGERLALVGENGEGKTTIVKLLTRLYDVTSGQILLDGVD
ncbi:MAG: ATP-binding cassette domain-containing protein, partial [Candidatus Acidiferrales bacterium]